MYGVKQVKTEEVDIPETGNEDILIRVRFCGICPSDIKYYTGARKPEGWPTIRGHEFSGEIAEVGSAAEGFKPGERVVGHGRTPCGRCYFCLREGPNVNYCLNLRTSGKESGGGTGAFCEYTRIHAISTYRIPASVSLEEAAFAEPLACCLNAILRSRVAMGDTVAVIGDGSNGLIITKLAKILGAGKAITIGHHDERLEVAKRIGVDVTINSAKEDPVKAVKNLTEGRGADSVILSVDSLSALKQGLSMVRKEGLVNFFASYPPTEFPIDPNSLLHSPSISLVGTRDFQPMHFAKGLELMANKSIDLRPLITHILPLEETEEGFKMATERRSLKVLVNCS